MAARKQTLYETNKIVMLKVTQIAPNPAQPRSVFDTEGLRELSDSIRQYGILQPLTARRVPGGYELVAGERRLRAARLAGLAEVPCLLLGVSEEQSSLLALVENLQRRDLDYIEEAEGLLRLVQTFGLSQDEAARRVGMSQSALANKLRLLRHPPEVIDLLRQHKLTERHARALLRIEDKGARLATLQSIIEMHLNVSQTDEYIELLLTATPEDEPPTPSEPEPVAPVLPASIPKKGERQRPLYVVKDVRLFLNSIDRAVDVMRQSGVKADCDRDETDGEIVLTIRIPKKVSGG